MTTWQLTPRYQAFDAAEAEPASIPIRLGATLIGDGADFAVFAPGAARVDVCLFARVGSELTEKRFTLNSAFGYWTGHVPHVEAGQLYGYRVHGRWAPELGLYFNPAKVLLDPYARAILKTPTLCPALYAHKVNDALEPTAYPPLPDDHDSALVTALGIVLPDTQTAADTRPFTPWDDTVIYEAHVKGLTQLAPDIPEELRGTYAGLAHPHTIDRLKQLGITAIELLPIHAKMAEPFLTQRGLPNYWGYSTLSFFSPEPSYATRSAQERGGAAVVEEVRAMVRALHEAGIEVILDVVYNHTCEGGNDGPTVSWRGLDQPSYYLHSPTDPARLIDTTGCGNSLDFRRQHVVAMALDSLRYWASDIGVDGFRFDLAVTLGRRGDQGEQFDSSHPFYVALTTDPLLRTVKIINEPWDLGPNGWQTGRFIQLTADWNDHFRDTARSFWVAQPRAMSSGGYGGDLRDLATRLAGSADLFGHGRIPGGRGAFASVNFITAHDGFTLRDLVSFDSKHNDANLENNRDGSNDNKSWNHGWEGDGTPGNRPNPGIFARRRQTMRNLLATLIFSTGTPMLCAGDEFGRTQQGNNNSYCQDNEISWLNYDHSQWQTDLRDTVAYLLSIRREHRVLRPIRFYTEVQSGLDPVPDLGWFDTSGDPMPEHKWFDAQGRTLQMLRSGRGHDVDALLVLNGSLRECEITLPEGRTTPFELVWDSTWERPRTVHDVYAPRAVTRIAPLSIRLFLANPAR
ncbi:MAG: glycogen debranching protein GlgX [Ancrocorticia sp.]|nr:glycogen debranching protein GlgX [Ancrocorticia sp.]MCI1895980.1 glycogen debranching protein GlgX [Ancrocorticia sp.]MCI1932456.1 glycogen debranching protein GlgX [Ancrocorticia sp.]MCI1964144.1 glycogen debranching protein GlgX [Ancrocorticia sp.]MCI2002581.1 glycogen debranching protein GlgX [Ancrocorticia sp.]